jgi:hypothetical protein
MQPTGNFFQPERLEKCPKKSIAFFHILIHDVILIHDIGELPSPDTGKTSND